MHQRGQTALEYMLIIVIAIIVIIAVVVFMNSSSTETITIGNQKFCETSNCYVDDECWNMSNCQGYRTHCGMLGSCIVDGSFGGGSSGGGGLGGGIDGDGDGVADISDICPCVYNPPPSPGVPQIDTGPTGGPGDACDENKDNQDDSFDRNYGNCTQLAPDNTLCEKLDPPLSGSLTCEFGKIVTSGCSAVGGEGASTITCGLDSGTLQACVITSGDHSIKCHNSVGRLQTFQCAVTGDYLGEPCRTECVTGDITFLN